MRVTARLFAVLREKAGVGEVFLDVEEGSAAADVVDALTEQFPQIERFIGAASFAVNAEYVDKAHPLSEGDEVALIPPVSGGAERVRVTKEPLQVPLIRASVQHRSHGAVAVFEGVVRDHNEGRQVAYLEYEAFVPMAEGEMERIAQEAERQWGPLRAALYHRTGRLEIGEVSMVVAVGSAHRAEAFDACRYIVEQIKARVPVWKKEAWEGGAEWIGSHEEEGAQQP